MRTRKRCTWTIAVISAAVTAAAAATITVTTVLSGPPPPHSTPVPAVPEASYAITVNNQSQTTQGRTPHFTVPLGEKLVITVDVTVPAHETVSKLWLGITDGTEASFPDGRPIMHPILLTSTRVPLRSGVHRFRFRWNMPSRLAYNATRQLSVGWAWPSEPGFPEPGSSLSMLAEFNIPGRPAIGDTPNPTPIQPNGSSPALPPQATRGTGEFRRGLLDQATAASGFSVAAMALASSVPLTSKWRAK